jgi:hypothetical protein
MDILNETARGRASGADAQVIVEAYGNTAGFEKRFEFSAAPTVAKAPAGVGGVNLGELKF